MGWSLAAVACFCMVGMVAQAQDKPKPADGKKPAAQKPAGRGEAKLTLDGKDIKITYGRPSTSGPGYKTIQTAKKDGFIWRMGSNQATKLETAADLKFGDKVIKAGSYSLWAKRVGDGWHLVFNTKPDIWGTMHDANAKFDVAEVPLKNSKVEKEVELVTIELNKAEGGGEFKLTWGKEAGATNFSIAK